MPNPHLLNGPEITVLLAALGLMLNASVTVLLARKSLRIPPRDAGRVKPSPQSRRA